MEEEMFQAVVHQTLEVIKLKKEIEILKKQQKENERKISYYDALEEEGWIDFIEENQDLDELKEYIDTFEKDGHQLIKLPEGFSK
tara:strand:- start:1086 stop:1340 length:255 start_codon:yes stop_codon:yes gene_type:complete